MPRPAKEKSDKLGKKSRVDDYQRLSHREQILLVPATYIGGIGKIKHRDYVLNLDTMLIEEREIDVSDGESRLFLEILSNSGDTSIHSMNKGIKVPPIEIIMEKQHITIANGGKAIPVEYSKENDDDGNPIYVPTLIFGHLLTSSNYDHSDETKMGCGRNGYGAKLTNIFSTEFEVMVGDPETKKEFYQKWTDNMGKTDGPKITSYEGDAYVQVSYIMDFERMGYDKYEYTEDAVALFARHAADMGMTCKIPIIFNDIELKCSTMEDLAIMYFGPDIAKRGIYVSLDEPEWKKVGRTEKAVFNGNVKKKRSKKISNTMCGLDFAIFDTPDNGQSISFANGMVTKAGIHVDTISSLFGQQVLDSINVKKTEKDKNVKIHKLTMTDIKPHFSIISSIRLPVGKIDFESQSKKVMTKPAMKVDVTFNSRNFNSWDLIKKLESILFAKDFRDLKKSDGRKLKNVKLEKAEDANLAGTKDSQYCVVLVIEGDSAAAFARDYIKYYSIDTDDGRQLVARDVCGIFPLRGKPLNVRGYSGQKRLLTNKEFSELKICLGLREEVDYTNDREFSTLRYNKLFILADADPDGKHIASLLLNYFHCRYPSLIKREFIVIIRTPILTAVHGKTKKTFMSETAFENWKKKCSDSHLYRIKYFKGLGSFNSKEVCDYIDEIKSATFISDDDMDHWMDVAFERKLSNERREFMKRWSPILNLADYETRTISEFLTEELPIFWEVALRRAIPGLDGLKESQRKILWSILKSNKLTNGDAKTLSSKASKIESTKVSIMQGDISKKMNYKHGPTSLEGAIIGMTQFFIGGSNNIPWFRADGQFGTRNEGGADHASPRYIFASPSELLPMIYRPEDTPLLEIIDDEGPVEPKVMLPIIPSPNGADGIAVGRSTWIPNYHPLDLVNWIRNYLLDNKKCSITPWYRGFTGKIYVTTREKARMTKKKIIEKMRKERNSVDSTNDVDDNENISDNESVSKTADNKVENMEIIEEDFEEYLDSYLQMNEDADEVGTVDGKMSVVTIGRYENDTANGIITIDELPIGRWMLPYNKFLENLLAEKKITDIRNMSDDNHARFEIKGMKQGSIEGLRLKRSFGLTNICLLDPDNHPLDYETPENMFEDFVKFRLPYYQKRKDYMLKAIDDEIDKINERIRFIMAVISEKIIIIKNGKSVPKKEAYSQLDKFNFDHKFLTGVSLLNLTPEDVNELKDKVDLLDKKRDNLNKKSDIDLWLNDLDDFEDAYNKWMKNVEKEEAEIAAKTVKYDGKSKKTRKPRQKRIK